MAFAYFFLIWRDASGSVWPRISCSDGALPTWWRCYSESAASRAEQRYESALFTNPPPVGKRLPVSQNGCCPRGPQETLSHYPLSHRDSDTAAVAVCTDRLPNQLGLIRSSLIGGQQTQNVHLSSYKGSASLLRASGSSGVALRDPAPSLQLSPAETDLSEMRWDHRGRDTTQTGAWFSRPRRKHY